MVWLAAHVSVTANDDANDDREVWVITTVESYAGAMQFAMQLWYV